MGDPWFGLQPYLSAINPKTQNANSKVVVYNKFMGRLGNQLFQFFTGYYFAKRNGMDYCLDVSFQYKSYIRSNYLPRACSNKKRKVEVLKEDAYATFEHLMDKIPDNSIASHIELNGYFQSFRYFQDDFDYNIVEWYHEKKTTYDIAMHLRMGDKKNDPSFVFPPKSWFESILYDNQDKKIVIVTENKKQIPYPELFKGYKVVNGNLANDFNVLLNAKTNVCTMASTLCWMASFLGKSDMIYYQREVNMQDRKHKGKFIPEDYYLPYWIKYQSNPKGEPLVLVGGTGHSGTSIVNGLLEISGLKGISENVVDKYHPHGLFESEYVTNLNKAVLNGSKKTYDIYTAITTGLLKSVNTIKHPQLVRTIQSWTKAAKKANRPLILVIAYRNPVDACNHPNCPNCADNCFDEISDGLSLVSPSNHDTVIFDFNKFQECGDPYGYYQLFVSKIHAKVKKIKIASREKMMSLFSKRNDYNPSLILGKTYNFYGKQSKITQEIIRTHEALTENFSGLPKDNVTTVIGLFDIGRKDRTFKAYTEMLKKTVQRSTHPIVLFAEENFEFTRYNQNVYFYKIKLEDVPLSIKYSKKNIELYQRKNSTHIEERNPWYNTVNLAKISLLRTASVINPFNSSYFLWLDAGISRFGKTYTNYTINRYFPGYSISLHSMYNIPFVEKKVCQNRHFVKGTDSFLSGGIQMGSKQFIIKMDDKFSNYLNGVNHTNNDQILINDFWCKNRDVVNIINSKTYLQDTIEFGPLLQNKKIIADTTLKYAVSTMVITTRDKGYVEGAIKLGKSIKRHLKMHVDMILLEIKTMPINKQDKINLQNAGWDIRIVDLIPPKNIGKTFGRFREQFTKLQLWNMTEYQKIVYIDSDGLVIRDFSALFEIPFNKLAVARDIADGKWRKTFNMGVFMMKPNAAEFERLKEQKDTIDYDVAMSEQGFLNVVYKDEWTEIPFKYNANIAAYSQLAKYWKEQDDINIIHYTMEKPWKRTCWKDYEELCEIWKKN